MEISVIVPIYNVESFLEKCVETLLKQTISSYEIILVDDGSTDNSGRICDDLGLSNPDRVVVVHQSNAGLSAARNIGIDIAKGRYITFVDSDDWVEPDFLQVLYKSICLQDTDLSCCGLIYDRNEGQSPILRTDMMLNLTHKQLYHQILQNSQFYGYVCNKMFKLSKIGNLRFDKSLKSAEDMDFVTRYSLNCGYASFNPSQLYHYRQRLGSMTGTFSFNPMKLSVLKVNGTLIDIYASEAPELLDYVIANYVKTNLNILGRMLISHIKDIDLEIQLKNNVSSYWDYLMCSKVLPLTLKINLLVTNFAPALLLKFKQFLIKYKYK